MSPLEAHHLASQPKRGSRNSFLFCALNSTQPASSRAEESPGLGSDGRSGLMANAEDSRAAGTRPGQGAGADGQRDSVAALTPPGDVG